MTVDLSELKVITLADIETAVRSGAKDVVLAENAILTPSAKEALQVRGVATRSGSKPSAAAGGVTPSDPRIAALFDSAEARAIKEEICAVGKKLWLRSYVDGNGGNISYRIGPNAVICTPTLTSKFDLRPQDMCMVDPEGKQLAGGKP